MPILNVFAGASTTSSNSGSRFATGTRAIPIRRIETDATYIKGKRSRNGQSFSPITLQLAAGEKVVVFDYINDNNGFNYFELQTDNAAHCAAILDTPESATDLRPSGDNQRTNSWVQMSHTVYTQGTQDALIHPTTTKYTQHTNGIPAIWDSGYLIGRTYYFSVFNPNATPLRVSIGAVGARLVPSTIIGGQPPEVSGLVPFTTIVPWAGCTQLYVDPVGGNDANAGTELLPLKTVAEAATRLNFPGGNIRRDGGIVWVKAGTTSLNDTFNCKPDGLGARNLFGGQVGKPLIFAAYGTGARPVITPPEGVPALNMASECGPVEIYGIEVRGTTHVSGDYTSEGLVIIGSSGPLYIEDVKLHDLTMGLRAQGQGGRVVSVKAWRCIFGRIRNTAGYGGDQHSQGTYITACDFAHFEECTFYENGDKDQFSHANYWVHDRTSTRRFLKNVVIRPGMAGIQARGGLFEVRGNLFLECGNAIGIGHPLNQGTAGWCEPRGDFVGNWVVNPIGPGDTAAGGHAGSPDTGIAYAFCDGVRITDNRIYGAGTPLAAGGIPAVNPIGTVTLERNTTASTITGIDVLGLADRLVNRSRGVWAVNHQAAAIATEIGATA